MNLTLKLELRYFFSALHFNMDTEFEAILATSPLHKQTKQSDTEFHVFSLVLFWANPVFYNKSTIY